MIIVLGNLRVREGDLPRLTSILTHQVAASRAEVGCDHYALAHDIIEPALIRVSERWQTQDAIAAHLVSDHMVAFNFDLRTAKILSGRVDSYHPGGEVRKLIDFNADDIKFSKERRSVVIVMGTICFAPGEIDRLIPAMRAQVQATRDEAGCAHYAFARDAIDPDLLHISERWEDNTALTAHFGAPHMAAFNAELRTANIVAISVKAYDGEEVRTLIGD
jgi:quinol monooxygenase YgiN